MMSWIRLLSNVPRATFIIARALRYGLDQWLLRRSTNRFLRTCAILLQPLPRKPYTRGQSLRLFLESLGPIFVKFGQVLSTRRDLIPTDIVDELALLQDRVPPFAYAQVRSQIAQAFGKNVDAVFTQFDEIPIASASVAQVHFGRIVQGGRELEVAVKVLRPDILPIIEKDLALLRMLASWLARFSHDGKRLKPEEVVNEFDHYLHDELDLLREAANCSQLGRNFKDSPLIRHPEVYWDFCRPTVMVMERMHGVPISRLETLRQAGVDIPKLARDGVVIFFTQVFRDGFFHADMHPGNIQVSIEEGSKGQYIGIDFGIVGSLNDQDKHYLAHNFLAFFNRDYRRVAQLHIDSAWVPASTRVDELENAVRSVCEPIFGKPLAEISFGLVLMRLFQVSRRFNVEIQPQLVLLQKTLLNVEGLGRQLDPYLDLWATAKPQLENWMNEQIGPKGLWRNIKNEAIYWPALLPQLPRLLHERLQAPALPAQAPVHKPRTRFWLYLLLGTITVLLLFIALGIWLPIFAEIEAY
ncbi:MAG: hypothetical protein RLZZ502_1588 [Pseudomonadota bacterium]|jgi:ubiquinone biosynthesis protein